jgi:hypothetical protein
LPPSERRRVELPHATKSGSWQTFLLDISSFEQVSLNTTASTRSALTVYNDLADKPYWTTRIAAAYRYFATQFSGGNGLERMTQQTLGISHLLHDFRHDQQERRQYPRVPLRFAIWWLKGKNTAVAGIGIEISGGGLQFLLEHKIENQSPCSLVFQINDRRMQAKIIVLHAEEVVFEEQPWQHHRAKFAGMLEADFAFIMALTDGHPLEPEGCAVRAVQRSARDQAEKRKLSVGSLESYDMLPLRIREKIVARLVAMKRLSPPRKLEQALLAAHYTGFRHENDDTIFHRFFMRTRINSLPGTLVFNTEVLISDDGTELHVRE